MEDKIKLRAEEFESYDKKEIALAIRNSTLDDEMECLLLDENIIWAAIWNLFVRKLIG